MPVDGRYRLVTAVGAIPNKSTRRIVYLYRDTAKSAYRRAALPCSYLRSRIKIYSLHRGYYPRRKTVNFIRLICPRIL